MEQKWIPDRVTRVLDEVLPHLLEVGVVLAGLGGVAVLYSLGLLRG